MLSDLALLDITDKKQQTHKKDFQSFNHLFCGKTRLSLSAIKGMALRLLLKLSLILEFTSFNPHAAVGLKLIFN